MGRTPGTARGPRFIFRKIHLYGKTKKSTHGHQTTLPKCTNFWERGQTGSLFPKDSKNAVLSSIRRTWRPRRAREVGLQGRPVHRPTLHPPTYPAHILPTYPGVTDLPCTTHRPRTRETHPSEKWKRPSLPRQTSHADEGWPAGTALPWSIFSSYLPCTHRPTLYLASDSNPVISTTGRPTGERTARPRSPRRPLSSRILLDAFRPLPVSS